MPPQQIYLRTIPQCAFQNGNFGQVASCPSGQFAYGYRLRSQAPQGNGDDTGLNDIELYCAERNSSSYTRIWSDYQTWGSFSSPVFCSGGQNPLMG